MVVKGKIDMSRWETNWEKFAGRWRGVINDSVLVITRKTLERKARYERAKIFAYVLSGATGLWLLYRGWANYETLATQGFNLEIAAVALIVVSAASLGLMLVNVYKGPYHKIKDLLMKRVEAQFCNCYYAYWGLACEHKEKFLKDVKETFDLNLYY